MKKLIYIILLFSNYIYSQNYDIYIITIKPTDRYLDEAIRAGKTQDAMQKRYDNNMSKIQQSISHIKNELAKLNYPQTLKDNIDYGWNQVTTEFTNCIGGNTILSNSAVTNLINLMTSSINQVISNEVRLYNGSRQYNYYDFNFCKKYSSSNNSNSNYVTLQIGKTNLNYKFSFGVGLGLNSKSNGSENVNEIIATLRIGKKTTLENLFEKFTPNKENFKPVEEFKKQFAITSIYNYNISFFSENLFLITGVGLSYSKTLSNIYSFENKINPVVNLGLDYNFKKTPVSLGFYSRLNFGSFSSTGFSLKYLVR